MEISTDVRDILIASLRGKNKEVFEKWIERKRLISG